MGWGRGWVKRDERQWEDQASSYGKNRSLDETYRVGNIISDSIIVLSGDRS